MKRQYLAFLVLTMLTFMFVGKSDVVKAQPPTPGPLCFPGDCTEDSHFPQGADNYHISTVFDNITLTFCTVRTKTKLYKYNCQIPFPYSYYRYKIESIEVFGACSTMTQDQLTQMSIRSIISSNFGYLNAPAWIDLFSCVELIGTAPERELIPCTNDCCRIYFEATWDVDGGTLDTIVKNSSGFCISNNYCKFQCEENDDSFPPLGDLETYNYIPQACYSGCGTTSSPTYRAVTNIGSDMIYADYSLAYENPLCFSLHWVNYEGTHDLYDVLERLIQKILKDIYDNQGNPQYIKLHLAACWQQPHSGINLYYPCSQNDCCTMTFEIQSSTSAILDSYEHLGYHCETPCDIEVCDLYNEFASSFTIGKSSIQFDLDQINNNINIMPNPNSGTFNLEFNAAVSEPHTIQVINLMGIEVYSTVLNPTIGINQMNIDLTSIPTGAYYLQIINKGKVESEIKFLKN